MESAVAYEEIQKWAATLKLSLKNTPDPAARVAELAQAIAAVRLSPYPNPPEPRPEAVQALMRDYLGEKTADLERIGTVLETLVQTDSQKKVAALENQPYFGCHRTADTKPPHPPKAGS